MGEKIDRLGLLLEKTGGFVVSGIGFDMGFALTYYRGFYRSLSG